MQIDDPIIPVRARDQVLERLRRMIGEGVLAPDARIEEVEIAQRLGVSRTPVREALIALEQEGLVQSRPSRGFTVAPANKELVEEAYPILGALESEALRLSAEKLQSRLPELNALTERLAACDDKIKQYRLDYAFHELFTEDCGNQRLLSLLDIERVRARRFDGFIERGVADKDGTCKDHQEIVAAIRKKNYDAASQAVVRHWIRGKEVVLKWLQEK